MVVSKLPFTKYIRIYIYILCKKYLAGLFHLVLHIYNTDVLFPLSPTLPLPPLQRNSIVFLQ